MEILSEIEAAEDEILLEELDWSKVGNDPKEIQVALAVQSDTLNTEIIDFLLQWEEDENVNKTLPDSKRVRDTFEVLDALSQVDNELEGVDVWITEQIDRLSLVSFDSIGAVIKHFLGTSKLCSIITLHSLTSPNLYLKCTRLVTSSSTLRFSQDFLPLNMKVELWNLHTRI
jgi:hypothetical protein